MPFWPRLRSTLRNWLRPGQVDRELDEELAASLAQLTDEKLAAGLSPAEAARAARLELGGPAQIRQEVRGVRAGAFADTLVRDLRHGVRGLRKNPVFTAVAVVTLAVAIGVNTTVFSLVNAVLLRPLPVDQPDDLVALFTSDHSGPLYGGSSYPDYLDLRDRNDVLSGLAAYSPTPFNLSAQRAGDAGPDGSPAATERLFGEIVTGNYFSVLGVTPAAGRALVPMDDSAPGAHPVAVISHALWQRRFGGDPDAVGRSIRLNGHPFTIVGVAPRGFSGLVRGIRADLWVPMMMHAQAIPGDQDLGGRFQRWLFLMGRLRPGVGIDRARSAFQAIAAQLRDEHPPEWTNVRDEPRVVTVEPESTARVFPAVREPVVLFLSALMAVVGLVLLIACTNLAGLLVARGTARRGEMAIRLALGAGRPRLVRQLLTESLLLSLLGGLAGLLLNLWGGRLLVALLPAAPVPVEIDLALDRRVLAFAAGLTLLTTLLFGLLPALASSRLDLLASLRGEPGATVAEPRKARLRSGLVAVQVALSVLLLAGAGLFVRSLHNASRIPLGFDPSGTLVLSLDLALQGYGEKGARRFQGELLERARTQPGVVAASLARELPLGAEFGTRRALTVEGHTARAGEDPEVHTTTVGPGYFEAMRTPLVRGRGFSERDDERSPRVAVVNQAFARRYWPGQDPLGKHIQLGSPDPRAPQIEIVGVAADGKYVTLGEDARPFFFLPLWQDPAARATLVVRSAGSPADVLAGLRRLVAELDGDLPVHAAMTMDEHLAGSLLPARLAAGALGAFGIVALALAALGLYGVVSYSVALRTREIGVRMALGARRRDILALIVGQGVRLTLIGIVLGLAVAWATTRWLASLLYGIRATDPLTFAGVAVLLGAVALTACVVPAYRAACLPPASALRNR